MEDSTNSLEKCPKPKISAERRFSTPSRADLAASHRYGWRWFPRRAAPPMQHGDLLSPSPTWGVKPELQKPGSSHGDHSVTNHSYQLVVSRRPAGHVTPARLPAAFPGSPSLRYSRRAESSGRGRRQVGWDVDKLSDLCATRKQRLTSPRSNECKQGLPGRAGTWA